MKILTICHDHPSLTTGGTEFQAKDLARHLDRIPGVTAQFLAVTTALSRSDATPASLERMGDDLLLRTGAYDAFSMTRLDGPAWTDTLSGAIAHLAPDLVHLHGLDRIGASAVTLLRRRFPRLRLVLTLHDYQLICANDGLLMRTLDGALCRAPGPVACNQCFPKIEARRHALRTAHLSAILSQIDAFIAPSEFIRQRYIDWGLPAARVHLIRNAVPEITASAARPLPEGPPNRFAYLGNLAHHKGLSVLLKTAALLKDDRSGVRITVHGDLVHSSASVRARTDALIEDAWPTVQHLGRFARTDVPDLLAAADWLVLPAIWHENAPLAVLEALEAGKPVICPPVGGLPELVRHGVNGLHVPRGDAHALADTLRKAATDRAAWRRLSEGTRLRPRFSDHLNAHHRMFEALLQKVPA